MDESVTDGFFDSMQRLKCPDMSRIHSTPEFQSTLSHYTHIMQICESGSKIPPISLEESTKIIFGVKAEVNNFCSITANHFIYAGPQGIENFHFLLATLIDDLNHITLDELNSAWACISYKGHQKDKESD